MEGLPVSVWLLLWLAMFGLPLLVCGGFLRLCEWSYRKPPNGLGGQWLMAAGLACGLPLALFVLVHLLHGWTG